MRIEGTLRSPVNTCITDANAGRVTINAYGIEKYMIDNYNRCQNQNGTAWVLIKQLIMWLQLRLDWLICTFYAVLALMLIFLSDNETFSEVNMVHSMDHTVWCIQNYLYNFIFSSSI